MSTINLELTIAQSAEGQASAALRAELPNHRADLAQPAAIKLKPAVLLELADDPDAYGAALTAMVFTPALREGWRQARGHAEGASAMRVRLLLDGDDALHAIRWELLRDPIDHSPLAYSERTPFSRYMANSSLADLQAPARPDLRAVVAVANPTPLAAFGLTTVDVPGEVARARAGLGAIATTILDGAEGRPAASLANIASALREGVHILYLVGHGRVVEGRPLLYLEQEGDWRYRPTDGDALVQAISQLQQRPLLVVLASCQGAGDSYALLAAVGPRLARAGVGAVIAMQGNVPVDLVAMLTPRLFSELRRDGQIDRALAAARAALPADQPWWMPALWMAVRDGRLWRAEAAPAAAPAQTGGISVGGNVGTMQVINISGGDVGSIIGSQSSYGAAPPPEEDPADVLRRRLAQHRSTLAHYLDQLAITGSAYVRPEVMHGIRQARGDIRRIKEQIRALGQAVDDRFDDVG